MLGDVYWDGVGLAESGGRDKLFAEMLGVHATKLQELIWDICCPLPSAKGGGEPIHQLSRREIDDNTSEIVWSCLEFHEL
jgi:hypothetical protein